MNLMCFILRSIAVCGKALLEHSLQTSSVSFPHGNYKIIEALRAVVSRVEIASSLNRLREAY